MSKEIMDFALTLCAVLIAHAAMQRKFGLLVVMLVVVVGIFAYPHIDWNSLGNLK